MTKMPPSWMPLFGSVSEEPFPFSSQFQFASGRPIDESILSAGGRGMNMFKAVEKLGKLYMDRVESSRDMRTVDSGRRGAAKKLRAKWARAPRPQWAYHGASWHDASDISKDGLRARKDRRGVSVTTDPARARLWGWFKSSDEEPMILRTEAARLRRWTPDMFAPPALPEYDFLTGTIPPERLEVKVGRRWVPLLKWRDDAIRSDPVFAEDGDDELEDARHVEWAEWAVSRDLSEKQAARFLSDAGVDIDPDVLKAKIDDIWIQLVMAAEAYDAKRRGRKKPKKPKAKKAR